MNVLVNSSDIAPRLSNPARYLAIRIESQEDSYKQFAQICKSSSRDCEMIRTIEILLH